MSLDFLAGFTIFILALIVVASMVPGLLIGLQSSGIDYDAVAYRTGVILAEDPGWPVPPASTVPWEQLDVAYKDQIDRIGLAVSRDTPNILSSGKIEAFFNTGFFSYPEDYRERVIFGDYPYSFNISLKKIGAGSVDRLGEPLPLGYGYIRRVVMIKEPAEAVLDGELSHVDSPGGQNFTVRLNCTQLLNPSISPAYRIDPRVENITIKMTNFRSYLLDPITPTPATLRNVTFYRASSPGSSFSRVPFSYDSLNPEKYDFAVDGVQVELDPAPGIQVYDTFSLTIRPGSLPIDENSVIEIRFAFYDATPATNIAGTFDYSDVSPPALTPAVMEVAVW